MGIMLVYDITQEKSFENIKNWIRNIEENAAADVEKMLLGNKCELNDKRQVTIDIYNIYMILYHIIFYDRFQRNVGNNWPSNMGSNSWRRLRKRASMLKRLS